ncbi:MAG: dihydrolipoamide acetyltransferase family protein, partial [Bacteroidota bacterium]
STFTFTFTSTSTSTKWHKNVGDMVKSGDLVAEIETDKATMEFESFQEGVLLYKGIEEGKSAPVDGVLAIFGKPGEDFASLLEQEKNKQSAAAPAPAAPVPPKASAAPTPAPVPVSKPTPIPVVAAPTTISSTDDGRIKVSPLAKRLAQEKGLDLSRIPGTGDGGRVVKRDVDWFKPGMTPTFGRAVASGITSESFEEVPVSQMRKTIARRLSESKNTAPHFYLTMDICMDRCADARESINAVAGLKISFNDMVIKAAAAALRQHPKINSSWLDDRIRINHHINIGVAVAVDEGLLVPVVRYADTKSLTQINAEVKVFATKAKEKKLQPSDWEGNTFTISNLGMFGIDEFTAIINPPDACILAVGGIREVPTIRNGQLANASMMKVTLSCDHRAVDGVAGAKFLQTLKGLLENPVILLGEASI